MRSRRFIKTTSFLGYFRAIFGSQPTLRKESWAVVGDQKKDPQSLASLRVWFAGNRSWSLLIFFDAEEELVRGGEWHGEVEGGGVTSGDHVVIDVRREIDQVGR